MLVLTMAVSAQAETLWFKSTAYAYAEVVNKHYYWSDWEKSNLTITIDLTKDVITIYSSTIQIYKVVQEGQVSDDKDGGRQVVFPVIDQDGDRGTVRLRITNDGTSQLYVDFNNIAWVYNVIKSY